MRQPPVATSDLEHTGVPTESGVLGKQVQELIAERDEALVGLTPEAHAPGGSGAPSTASRRRGDGPRYRLGLSRGPLAYVNVLASVPGRLPEERWTTAGDSASLASTQSRVGSANP